MCIRDRDEIGADYPEMYDYIEKVEDYIGRKITIVPSILTFDEVFHSRYQTGKRAGTMYGFPITIGPWCNDRLKLKTIRKHYKRYGEHINYLGIAADEPKRLAKLQPNCRAPLAEWGMTENDCINLLKERNLLNPLYNKFRRLGCWFCIKQNLDSLRILRKDYPKYWQMMLQWDNAVSYTHLSIPVYAQSTDPYQAIIDKLNEEYSMDMYFMEEDDPLFTEGILSSSRMRITMTPEEFEADLRQCIIENNRAKAEADRKRCV